MDAPETPVEAISAQLQTSDAGTWSNTAVTAQQAQTLFDSLEDGALLKDAAKAANMSRQTAWRLMRKYEGSLESASKYLATKALAFTEDWVKASTTASEKGDHRPAMQALQSIKAIEPITDQQARTSIAIIIGTPDQPIRVSSPAIDIEK